MNNKQIQQITSVADAEQAIARLEGKRSELLARGNELATVRASVAYKALNDEDAPAKQKLDQINKESVSHSHELASVDAALVTARQKLEAAQQHEAKQAAREQAKELRLVLDQFVETATQLDEALADVATLGHNLHQIQARMQELGAAVPNGAQLDSLGFRCLLTACAATPWHRHFEVLAPHERRTFAALVGIWHATNQKHLAARLGDEEAA
jgi:hypothetical protein